MHHYYVFNNKVVNEQACVDEAGKRFRQDGEKSWIHFHSAGATCTEKCYLTPKPKEA
jgi:hypothetical protein